MVWSYGILIEGTVVKWCMYPCGSTMKKTCNISKKTLFAEGDPHQTEWERRDLALQSQTYHTWVQTACWVGAWQGVLAWAYHVDTIAYRCRKKDSEFTARHTRTRVTPCTHFGTFKILVSSSYACRGATNTMLVLTSAGLDFCCEAHIRWLTVNNLVSVPLESRNCFSHLQ